MHILNGKCLQMQKPEEPGMKRIFLANTFVGLMICKAIATSDSCL